MLNIYYVIVVTTKQNEFIINCHYLHMFYVVTYYTKNNKFGEELQSNLIKMKLLWEYYMYIIVNLEFVNNYHVIALMLC